MPTGAPARWRLQDSSSLASIGQDSGVSASKEYAPAQIGHRAVDRHAGPAEK